MDPSPLPAGLASISPAHLHILVVDPAVAIDLVAEVRRDRPFTQVTLDVLPMSPWLTRLSPFTVAPARRGTQISLLVQSGRRGSRRRGFARLRGIGLLCPVGPAPFALCSEGHVSLDLDPIGPGSDRDQRSEINRLSAHPQ